VYYLTRNETFEKRKVIYFFFLKKKRRKNRKMKVKLDKLIIHPRNPSLPRRQSLGLAERGGNQIQSLTGPGKLGASLPQFTSLSLSRAPTCPGILFFFGCVTLLPLQYPLPSSSSPSCVYHFLTF
jgi:hypothetical protein